MNETRTIRHAVFCILLVALMFLAAIPAASAAPAIPSATLNSPADVNNVHAGDVISIQVGGLNTGDHFKYRITSTDLVTPSTSVSLTGVNMPFAFTTGTSVTTLTTTGVTLANNPLTVKYGGAEYSPAKTAGTDTITAYQNIKEGNYDVTLSALTKTATQTGIDYSVAGDVAAPVVSKPLSFTVTNVNTGHLTVEVINNGVTLLAQTFTIAAPPTTPVPLNPGGGSEGYGGSDGGNTGQGQGAPQSGPGELLAPPGFSGTSATLLHNEDGQVLAQYSIETDPAAGFSSSLDIPTGTKVVSSTGQAVGQITITPLDPTKLPDLASNQYSFSGLSVECEPSGTQFSSGTVTLTFSLTEAQWAEALAKVNGDTSAMTIQFYDAASHTWATVPTVVDPVTHKVSAQITHFSTYALFYSVAKEAPSTPVSGSPVTPAPLTTSSAPVMTAAKTQMAPPSTTQSPGLPGLVVVGAVGLVGLFVMRKKQ